MQSHPYSLLAQQLPVTIVGAAVNDSILNLNVLPQSGQDIQAKLEAQQIGGCAFNVARILRKLSLDVINGMPIGAGPWGQIIEQSMLKLGLPVMLRHTTLDNGWCLALVEPDGERTFVTIDGCETDWDNINLSQLPSNDHGIIYISGYEVAGQNSGQLQQWILNQPLGCLRFFDPGPRLTDIDKNFLDQLMQQNTLLTLNRQEAAFLFGEGDSVIEQVQHFIDRYSTTVIVRLDVNGAWVCQSQQAPCYVPAYQINVVDTIGAGDSHCAGVITGLAKGLSLVESVELANKIAALTVNRCGADNPPDWRELANFSYSTYPYSI